ncbi:hypothetical protein ACQUQU_15900 [Thalassolituus sp. LLYu03]|uniref:hypothetical protein n=1 Tax=Thalassolituus sp. LLYu03 TaxID=3421656 RepID=UPI003D2E2BF9
MMATWKRTTLMACLVGLLSACGGDSGSRDFTSSTVGSTSGMVTQNGYLVVLTSSGQVRSYDLAAPDKPALIDTLALNSVETLSVEGSDLILVGARSGSYILKIDADGLLSQLSFARHARSCDPAIASDDLMYVTVRAGNTCGDEGEDRLLIYDTSSEDDTWLLGVLPLPQPQGLALSGSVLYICTGDGLQEVDVSNPLRPQTGTLYSNLSCNDLIVQDNDVVLTGDAAIILATLDQLATPSAQIQTGQ